jgi:hypothetical protein
VAAGGNGSRSAQSLQERVQNYLLKVQNKSVFTGSSTAINTGAVGTDTNESQNNISASIKKIRMRMLEAPGLNGGTSSISSAIEQSRPSGGLWGDAFHVKKDFGRKSIIHLSFDPTTGQCGSCSMDPGCGGGRGRGGARQ